MVIALDAMGGDFCPQAEIQGVANAIREIPDMPKIIVVGDQELIKAEMCKYGDIFGKIEIVHASERVLMNESPSKVLKSKPDASMIRAVQLCVQGKADAVISAGNTGAFMAASFFILGRLEGVDRPAIGLLMPTLNPLSTPSLMLDAGANVGCKPRHLEQFAFMGAAYMNALYGMDRPKVALLSVGEESTKGNEVVIETHAALQKSGLNFIGNIEGNDILPGKADVIVCDGFVGNIVLKLYESFPYLIRKKLLGNTETPESREFIRLFDRDLYGCGPLLGVRGVVSIAHGNTNARGFVSAIATTQKAVQNKTYRSIEQYLKNNRINGS